MSFQKGLLMMVILSVLGGCAVMPVGPSVTVMPGPGKPFDVFVSEDRMCRQWAQSQIGGTSPGEAAGQQVTAGAVIGGLLGAGLGAAIGSATGDAGTGAAIGAGVGILGGSSAAMEPAYASAAQLQRAYDIAYQQCMYSYGNEVPGVARRRTPRYIPPPPPPGGVGPR